MKTMKNSIHRKYSTLKLNYSTTNWNNFLMSFVRVVLHETSGKIVQMTLKNVQFETDQSCTSWEAKIHFNVFRTNTNVQIKTGKFDVFHRNVRNFFSPHSKLFLAFSCIQTFWSALFANDSCGILWKRLWHMC